MNKIIVSSGIILNVRINTESMNWQAEKKKTNNTKPNTKQQLHKGQNLSLFDLFQLTHCPQSP